MKCKNCGMENAMPTDVNCWNCGKPLSDEQTAVSTSSPETGSIHLVCGPTAGCGEIYELEDHGGGFFKAPLKCPHCGTPTLNGCVYIK